jgi:dihydrolipoamide dehydrogenase
MSGPSEIRVPDIGDFTDVPVIEIHVSPGDEISPEDPLVTLESDKATMDVPSPVQGVVKQLYVNIGDRVSEGSVLLTAEADSAGPSHDEETGASAATESSTATETSASNETEALKASETEGSTASGSEGSTASGSKGSTATETREAQQQRVSVQREPEPPERRDGGGEREAQVVVLGSGPGGYTTAFRAADLGLKTVLVERYETLGGVCLNVGCIPSKALLHAARVIAEAEEMGDRGIAFGKPKIDLAKLLSWKEAVVGKLTGGVAGLARQRKVEVVTGEGKLTGAHELTVGDRTITFDSCVIAAGSEAARLSDLPEDPRIVTSTGALFPDEIPKRLLVIGGGIIGLEMATVYDALGTKVTVVELMDQLIPGCDADLVRMLQKRVEPRYEAIKLSTRVTAIKPQKNGLKVTLSDESSQIFDRILVAVGRTPLGRRVGAEAAGVTVDERGFIPVDDQMRTNIPGIYAIGDVVGAPLLAHKASHQGKVAAEVIAGESGASFDARAVPAVAYTDPEVAWMGMTETEARANGTEYEKATFPWSASGRALTLARDDGLTKALFEPETKRLLGAGIVGVGAGELIAETVHALEMGADLEDVALTIHPHPTLSETVGFAAELGQGTITDLMPPRAARRARA